MAHYAGLSVAQQTLVLNAINGGTPWTAPSALYLALFTTEPDSADANGVEVSTSGTAYARQAVTLAAWNSGTRATSADIFFPVATASWGTIVAFGLYTSGTVGAGDLIFRGPCTSTAITTNQRFEVVAGNLTVGLPQKVT